MLSPVIHSRFCQHFMLLLLQGCIMLTFETEVSCRHYTSSVCHQLPCPVLHLSVSDSVVSLNPETFLFYDWACSSRAVCPPGSEEAQDRLSRLGCKPSEGFCKFFRCLLESASCSPAQQKMPVNHLTVKEEGPNSLLLFSLSHTSPCLQPW